jgi:hypothetical protein
MKKRFVAFSVVTVATAAAIVLEQGNADLMKCVCVISSAICGAEYARSKVCVRTGEVILSSAVSAAIIWGLIGFVVVMKQPTEATWEGKVSMAVYISVSAALLCAGLGALIGCVYYAFVRSK